MNMALWRSQKSWYPFAAQVFDLHTNHEPWGIKVECLAQRDVFPNNQSQRDWSYLGKVYGDDWARIVTLDFVELW
jgi:hypothetical protein